MTAFEKTTINNAFNRCFNLQEMVKNPELRNDALQSLSEQTGIRVNRLEEIV